MLSSLKRCYEAESADIHLAKYVLVRVKNEEEA